MHTLLHSVPPTLQQATTNPHLCQRLLDTHGKSGSVSCGVIAPFSGVLVRTSFPLCPPRVCFPVLYKFWQLCDGVNGDLLQEDLCHTHIQSPCPYGRPLPTPYLHRRCSNTVLSQSPWGLWVLVCTNYPFHYRGLESKSRK